MSTCQFRATSLPIELQIESAELSVKFCINMAYIFWTPTLKNLFKLWKYLMESRTWWNSLIKIVRGRLRTRYIETSYNLWTPYTTSCLLQSNCFFSVVILHFILYSGIERGTHAESDGKPSLLISIKYRLIPSRYYWLCYQAMTNWIKKSQLLPVAISTGYKCEKSSKCYLSS